MRRWLRFTLVAVVAVILLLGGLLASALAWRSATTTVDAPEAHPLTDRRFEATPERLERGRYLVENVAHCFSCHSQGDWEKTGLPRPGTEGGGGLIPDDIIPFKVYASNISPDPETGAGTWSDDAFVRALRQGIGHDGRTLFPFMPYFFFRSLSDEDLASIIVYVRSIPPVRNKVPVVQWPETLKKLYPPLPPLGAPTPPPDASDPVKRGEYLATIGNCAGCHTPVDENLAFLSGLDFAGGAPLHGPWGKVASSNITPDASGIAYSDEDIFLTTIRTGKVNGVRPLNHIMPWQRFRDMTDSDLKDIFAYLRTLKPVKHRVDNTEPVAFCRLCNQTHGFGDRN
jgi:mono/diheme cytochrome c family protein